MSLKPLLSRYTGRAERYTNPIPRVLDMTVSWLDSYGLEEEGIFRLSGSLPQIEYYRNMFNKGIRFDFGKPAALRSEIDPDPAIDPHTVAGTLRRRLSASVLTSSGLLKLYLRELPEPLIPYELYDPFINTFSEIRESQDRCKTVK